MGSSAVTVSLSRVHCVPMLARITRSSSVQGRHETCPDAELFVALLDAVYLSRERRGRRALTLGHLLAKVPANAISSRIVWYCSVVHSSSTGSTAERHRPSRDESHTHDGA